MLKSRDIRKNRGSVHTHTHTHTQTQAMTAGSRRDSCGWWYLTSVFKDNGKLDRRVMCQPTDGPSCMGWCFWLHEVFASYPVVPCAPFQKRPSLPLRTQAQLTEENYWQPDIIRAILTPSPGDCPESWVSHRKVCTPRQKSCSSTISWVESSPTLFHQLCITLTWNAVISILTHYTT